MTIIKGDQGGIIFRASAQDGMFYYFHINRNGMYALETMNHFNSTGTIANGPSAAIKTGRNQTNVLAVVAKGNTIELFVNRQMISSVPDTTYIQGQIGIIAENTGDDIEVAFSNAKVWTH
jgi:hypothetical protein